VRADAGVLLDCAPSFIPDLPVLLLAGCANVVIGKITIKRRGAMLLNVKGRNSIITGSPSGIRFWEYTRRNWPAPGADVVLKTPSPTRTRNHACARQNRKSSA